MKCVRRTLRLTAADSRSMLAGHRPGYGPQLARRAAPADSAREEGTELGPLTRIDELRLTDFPRGFS